MARWQWTRSEGPFSIFGMKQALFVVLPRARATKGLSSAMGLTICGGSSHLELYNVELELKLVPEQLPISVGSQSRSSASCTRPIWDGARHTTTCKPAFHVCEIYELKYLLYRMYRQSSHEPYHLCAPWWTALAGMGCSMSHHGRERFI